MKIGLYDDNNNDIEILTNCIKHYLNKKSVDYEIDICLTSAQLIDNFEKYDIVFLDIEIGEENGIDIGMRLRDISVQTIIIITSKHPKYLIDGYKIKADRYLIKPILQETFEAEMENIMQRYFYSFYKFNEIELNKLGMRLKDVLYIEILGRKSIIHLLSGNNIETNYTLKYWLNNLDKKLFIQSHKAFIINLLHVSTFENIDVIMLNDEKVPLSRHFKRNFEKEYISYIHRTI